MEKDGIITRTIFPEVPPHVEYSMAEFGSELMDIIRSFAKWGSFYISNLANSEASCSCLERVAE